MCNRTILAALKMYVTNDLRYKGVYTDALKYVFI